MSVGENTEGSKQRLLMADTKTTAADLLARSVWARTLPDDVRERVATEAYQSTHRKNEIVAHCGGRVQSWIGVVDGLLKLTALFPSGKVVMFTGVPSGGWLGEGSVIKREPRRYDVIAMRESHLLHIPRATFHWLLDTSVEFNRFIIDHLNEQLSQYIGMVESDRLTDPVAQLARAISMLFNPVLYPDAGSFLPISQEEFGELAGLSRQRTNAAIKVLERRGLVVAGYGGLLVKDLAGLKSLGAAASTSK
jgi:CRP/FNR family cyclic AMP-dependent transcriptional regulator